MKRCPQCEFIYEDDQSLCDMDGVLLVFDSRTLPHLALATVSAPMPEKTARRNRMVPAFATLILMLAVASVYYVSTMRDVAPPDFAPASVTSTTVEPPPPPATTEAAVTAPTPGPETAESPEVHPAPAPRPKPAAVPPTITKPTVTKSVPAKPEPKKDHSKVESILKKTGKILKKPFKF